MKTHSKYSIGLWMRSLLALSLVVLSVGCSIQTIHDRHSEVARRGAQVMPFDLDLTIHTFEQTNTGGVQTVTVKNPEDFEQIELIQTHLQMEQAKFSAGDFSDPEAIHGSSMPGLSELKGADQHLVVTYVDLPDGGQLTYIADTPEILDALHRWFEAQLSDHGDHARS